MVRMWLWVLGKRITGVKSHFCNLMSRVRTISMILQLGLFWLWLLGALSAHFSWHLLLSVSLFGGFVCCFLNTILSGTTRCFRLTLYISHPSPRSSHLCKRPWFLLLENVLVKNTEVKCHAQHIVSGVHTINMTCPLNLDHLAEVLLTRFLYSAVIPTPYCFLWKEITVCSHP